MTNKFLNLTGLTTYNSKIKSYIDSKVKVNTDAINTLNGNGAGSVNKKVADAIAAIIADAPEAYDTLKEISDWINSHADDAATMNSQINTNKTDISNLQSRITTLESESFTPITNSEINALFV